LFGTLVGDAVLREVAQHLTGVAEGAFVARMGGDEFGLVCEIPVRSGPEDLAAQIQSALAQETEVEGHQFRIDASIGISLFPSDAESATDLIANADAAMERAKADGRRMVRFFDRKIDRELRDHRAMHHDLQFALERFEISLEYQPQVKTDRSLLGFEALVR